MCSAWGWSSRPRVSCRSSSAPVGGSRGGMRRGSAVTGGSPSPAASDRPGRRGRARTCCAISWRGSSAAGTPTCAARARPSSPRVPWPSAGSLRWCRSRRTRPWPSSWRPLPSCGSRLSPRTGRLWRASAIASTAAAGRWSAALAAWERRPPVLETERVERARALSALGRFEAALGALAGLGAPAARLARAEAQLRLGQFSAALAAVRELKAARLAPEEAVEAAEIAARAFANNKTPEEALPWLRRALVTTGSAGTRAGLLAPITAAAAAWDRRDLAAMHRFLEESRAALDDPDLAWRWHQARALWELEADDGAERAVAHAEAALRRRRHLPQHRAADLWNDAG